MNGAWLAHMDAAPVLGLVGGKAVGLYRLLSLGLPVPRFVVLTAEAYRAACPEGRVPEELPAGIETLLDTAWAELAGAARPLAVRSSSVDEDGTERSYAGQMETFLNVADRPALSAAVLGCWRSQQGERARAYRAARTGATGGAGTTMAVVIQEMLAPVAAGVLFTVNPASGRIDELLISSLWGLGEGLVSGALDADTFVLDRAGTLKSRRLADKAEKVIPAPAGGTARAAVPADVASAPSLDDRTLGELCRAALAAEKLAGYPLDIEFAVAGGRLFFLQARPVTSFKPSAPPAPGRQVWDNSNINESYPNITSPLTYSFIRRAYRAVYWQFCELLGLSRREINRHDSMLSNMLGLLNGRVYYNLLNWYRLVALLPGFRFNKGFMEAMMGLRQPAEIEAPRSLSWTDKYLRELPRLARTGLRAVWLQGTLERRVRRFHRDFDAAHRRFSALDYETMDPAGVMRRYHEMEKEVLWRWKAPIINDFSAMIFYGTLKKLTVEWAVDADGGLQNALVSRQGQIESTEVASELWRVAELIGRDQDLKARFLATSPEQAIGLLGSAPAIREAFNNYLARYGDRGIAELKLESRSAEDDPSFCAAVLQNYLRGAMARPPSAERAESLSPQAARAELAERLRGKFTLLGVPKLWVYRSVLARAARAIRNRENQRLARTRAFAVVRRMFRAVGRSLRREGRIENDDDVFYLTLDELDAAAGAAASGQDLRESVRRRKTLYERFRAMPPLPDHLETPGPIGEEETVPVPAAEAAGSGVLKGLGACPGVIERTAAVLLEPDTAVRLDGEILVTRQTDPGWVVLFPSISGLVVERGSMLSHSAIVAREMGIPAVVGVPGAASRIRTGDLLHLDGSRGTVEILRTGDGGGE